MVVAGLVGHYRMVGALGAGGMGVVYKAIDTRLNRPVAIKAIGEGAELDTTATLRLRAEALAAASLDHPFICKIFELLDTDAGTMIVMEFVEGETLAGRLGRGVPPLAETLRLVSEVAEGLADAHAHGVIHRDVKPSNVMVTPHGHVKLLDFGIARVAQLGSGATTTHAALTKAGSAPGSPLYMAPEQALGKAVDARSDIFSVGVLLYECLTGQLPFAGDTRDAYVHEMLCGRTRPLDKLAPHVPEPVRRLVQECLATDPDHRPASMAAVAADLCNAANALTATGTFVPTSMRGKPRVITGVALAALILAVSGLSWRLWREPSRVGTPAFTLVPGVTWASMEWNPRLSPDGRWLSFISDRDGPDRLFVQPLEGGDAKPLAIPGQAVLSHAWSPDGREIGALVRDDLGILLQVVPAFFGGVARVAVRLEPALQEARISQWAATTIFLDVSLARGGRALGRLSLTDTRFTVATDTWPSKFDFRSFDVRPDGEWVTFAAVVEDRNDVWIAKTDGSAARRLTSGLFQHRHPRWADNRSRIVFQSNRGGQLDLWTMDTESGEMSQLTSSQTTEIAGGASVGSTTLPFEQIADISALWLVDASRTEQQVTADALSDLWPSADGSGGRLAFQRTRPRLRDAFVPFDARVFVAELRGHAVSEPQPIGDGYGARLTSDGAWLAYFQRLPDPRRVQLSVRNVKTGETMSVSQHVQLPSFSPSAPVDWAWQVVSWSPDGHDLYFVEVVDDRRSVKRFRPGSGEPPSVVVDGPSRHLTDVRVSPDARRLSYLLSTPDAVEIHVTDLASRADVVVAREPVSIASLFTRGWTSSTTILLLKRISVNVGGTARVEMVEIDLQGRARRLQAVDGAFPVTARLDAKRSLLYVTRADGGIHNIFAINLGSGAMTSVTRNRQPGVTFSGIEPLADGRVVYSRNERRQDIWLVHQGPG